MLRRTLIALLGLGFAITSFAQSPWILLDVFRAQREIEKRLLDSDLASLERVQEDLRSSSDRLVRLNDDLLRAEKEGEDVGSFSARSMDLRRAEVELTDAIVAAQQLRQTVAGRRAYIEQLEKELAKLGEKSKSASDDISGRWNVTLDPGGQRGVFELRLDGTLVQGQYQLAGGWSGSLRGTLVAGNLRLERIDAEQGFVAVYSGRLVARGGERRIEGSWEATNLAVGMPSQGAWVGRREDKEKQ